MSNEKPPKPTLEKLTSANEETIRKLALVAIEDGTELERVEIPDWNGDRLTQKT